MVGGRGWGAGGTPQGTGEERVRAPVLTAASAPPWGPDRRPSVQGILHFQLGRGEPMLHTRLRPHCREFLEKVARLYELHVFTFGSRLYAHTIAGEGRLPAPPSAVRAGRAAASFPFPVKSPRRGRRVGSASPEPAVAVAGQHCLCVRQPPSPGTRPPALLRPLGPGRWAGCRHCGRLRPADQFGSWSGPRREEKEPSPEGTAGGSAKGSCAAVCAEAERTQRSRHEPAACTVGRRVPAELARCLSAHAPATRRRP